MRNKTFPGLVFTALLVVVASVLFSVVPEFSPYAMAVMGGVILFSAVYNRPLWAMYAIAGLYSLTTLEFVYGSINVAYVDLIALVLFGAFALQSFIKFLRGEKVFYREEWPAVQYFILFIIAGGLSLLNTEYYQFGTSLKYLLRPLMFMYLMWVVLPLHYIKSKHVLENVMRIMFVMGSIFAVGGIFQFLFIEPTDGLRRMLPFYTTQFSFMGTNHNLLAEMLVGVIPFGYYFTKTTKDFTERELYKLFTIVCCVVAFMTYSRSGWLALGASAMVIAVLEYRNEIKEHAQKYIGIITGLVVIPIIVLLYLINQSHIAQGSNLNRLDLQEVAIALFLNHPLIGSGVGTFVNNVEQIQFYMVEYGHAIDSHSMFFKVLSEMGVVGIFAFYTFLIALALTVLKTLKNINHTHDLLLVTVLISSVAAVFVFENFGTSYFIAKMWLPIGLMLAGVALANKEIGRKIL